MRTKNEVDRPRLSEDRARIGLTDTEIQTHRCDRTHYHAALVGGKMTSLRIP